MLFIWVLILIVGFFNFWWNLVAIAWILGFRVLIGAGQLWLYVWLGFLWERGGFDCGDFWFCLLCLWCFRLMLIGLWVVIGFDWWEFRIWMFMFLICLCYWSCVVEIYVFLLGLYVYIYNCNCQCFWFWLRNCIWGSNCVIEYVCEIVLWKLC